MGDENELFYDNIILEGIGSDQEIHICRIEKTPNTLLIESTPCLPSTNSGNTSKAIADVLSTSANSTFLRLENYTDEKYDQAALNHFKKERLNDVKQQFYNEKGKVNLQLVKSLKEQIDVLKSKIYFLREEMKKKNNKLKMFYHSPKPSPQELYHDFILYFISLHPLV